MSAKKSFSWKAFGIILLVITVVFCYGLSIAFFNISLVNPIPIILISFGLSFATAFVFQSKWSVILLSSKMYVNIICHIIVFTGFFMCVILGINYIGRNNDDKREISVKVTGVYSETRYRTRRVRKGVYTRGDSYNVYYMRVKFSDGKSKRFSISTDDYIRCQRRTLRPDSVKLYLTRGALGFDVLEPFRLAAKR